jgi:hypothetical protein
MSAGAERRGENKKRTGRLHGTAHALAQANR